jgi:hypothetical protein
VVAGGKTTVPPAAAVAGSMALWIVDEPRSQAAAAHPSSAPGHPCSQNPREKNTVIYKTWLRDPYSERDMLRRASAGVALVPSVMHRTRKICTCMHRSAAPNVLFN